MIFFKECGFVTCMHADLANEVGDFDNTPLGAQSLLHG